MGPESRFFPAAISLGLVFGTIALFLAKKYRLFRLNPIFLFLITLPTLFLILVDSHRSVWVAAIVALLALIWLKEIKLPRLPLYILPLFFVVVIVWIVATHGGLNVFEYLLTRGSEIIAPEAQAGTAAWRLAQWGLQMQVFSGSPVTGIGFGGYWEVSGVSPHNVYVQTLVKLGSIGLILYLAIALRIFFSMRSWIIRHRTFQTSDMAIVVVALVVLLTSHAFYGFYAFEEYSWLFIGLGIAAIQDQGTS
ncbi:MAG: hypothetical protein C0410_09190 [Anaerolinea sp.]|nr:hypothetical protein [Anaerolinea sp.]